MLPVRRRAVAGWRHKAGWQGTGRHGVAVAAALAVEEAAAAVAVVAVAVAAQGGVARHWAARGGGGGGGRDGGGGGGCAGCLWARERYAMSALRLFPNIEG